MAQDPSAGRRPGAPPPRAETPARPPRDAPTSGSSLAAPARRAAFSVLLRLERNPEDRPPPRPDTLIARLEDAEGKPPEPRDRALARELIFGVLRWKRALDYALDAYSRRPVARLKPPIRTALRLGLYQLRYLDRVPPRAAVRDSVSLARASERPGAGGLVNAVLRAYLRADHPWPQRRGDPNLYLREGLSHPDWLVDRYLEALGPDGARKRLEANNRAPSVFLRVSRRRDADAVRRRLEEDGVRTERFPLAPRCLKVRAGRPQASPLHAEGGFHIQDAGSQLIGWLLPLEGARRCLDACAAPGGKATILAERLDPRRLIAADGRPRRAALLARTARRLSIGNLLPLVADAGAPPFAGERFDRVLLDVPCSGLGTLSRNPDIKWTASPARLGELGETARRLVRSTLGVLAPGGMLLYAACSLEPEETTDPIRDLLAETPELRQCPLGERLPPLLRPLVGEDGALRLRPEDHGTDGYFAALLGKSDG